VALAVVAVLGLLMALLELLVRVVQVEIYLQGLVTLLLEQVVELVE
jgi:hypothetical protein